MLEMGLNLRSCVEKANLAKYVTEISNKTFSLTNIYGSKITQHSGFVKARSNVSNI